MFRFAQHDTPLILLIVTISERRASLELGKTTFKPFKAFGFAGLRFYRKDQKRLAVQKA
jgi:hypothetical protein